MRIAVLFFILLLSAATAKAQILKRDFVVGERPRVEIENRFGQIRVIVADAPAENQPEEAEKTEKSNEPGKVLFEAVAPGGAVEEKEITAEGSNETVKITVNETRKRIDLTVTVPPRARLKITGANGEIGVVGNIESAEITSETGTIYADVPLASVKYNFLWTASRPRFLSDVQLAEIEEKAGGKFQLKGSLPDEKGEKGRRGEGEKEPKEPEPTASADGENPETKDQKSKTKKQKPISLNFTTRRGVILLNVPPSEVPSDLQARKLTNAAKAIVTSGDSILSEAIRKVTPKLFAEFVEGLPPRERKPRLTLADQTKIDENAPETLRRVNVSVADRFGRAIGNLKPADFQILEAGAEREIVGVEPVTTPFNLVLLLDVSGSVEERIDFIRKAARNFVNTVSPQDKLAVITFADDVQVLSNFTTERKVLSASLDSFEAGGATALYDALGYVLADTLKPLKGERTAVVILSDGDDNKSFIPFEPLTDALGESGTLVYPLYVPSGLIPTNGSNSAATAADPLRTRFLTVTTKAETEAKRLADVSGGVYFPIRRLEDLQKAYDDVVAQLRTAYSITFRSKSGATPRLRVSVKQPGAFVRVGTSVRVDEPEKAVNAPQFQKISFNRELPQTGGDITGAIKKIEYKFFAAEKLPEVAAANFNINNAPPAFILNDGKQKLAVSRWVSPKRTRSYPYERVYNTLTHTRRAAVIPVVKDEGANGDRDFLQWDTVSLLNLLEVHVVLGFYDAATKSPRRADALVDQQFNHEFVNAKLKEIANTNLSAYEWNLRELKNLGNTIEKARLAGQKISEQTGVPLHDEKGLINFERKLSGDITKFLEFSRQKSQQAQRREFLTEQPKETLTTRTKSRITISDYLGGKYFFTVDEAVADGDTLFLIESKHNQGGKFPATSDIKDALVKMILYRNLVDVRRGDKPAKFKCVARLTASKVVGAIDSDANAAELDKFIAANNFDSKRAAFLRLLVEEARANDFLIRIEAADTSK